MNFNTHSHLVGRHSFLSPSQPHWINYDFEKLHTVYRRSLSAEQGRELHALAADLINLNIKLPDNKLPLNQFVNDAIGYRMSPEQVLFYSLNCWGTADAISFRNNQLRIHDLKTGYTRVSMLQLEVYAALFCLEYDYKPNQIDIELRIYQTSSIIVHEPSPPEIRRIIEKIIIFDKKLEEFKKEDDEPWAE